jgi:hypothetical protein
MMPAGAARAVRAGVETVEEADAVPVEGFKDEAA